MCLSCVVFRITNPPGMGRTLPEFNLISRIPPDVAREIIIISLNAPNWVLYRLMVDIEILKCSTTGIVNKIGFDTLTRIKCDVILKLSCQINEKSNK